MAARRTTSTESSNQNAGNDDDDDHDTTTTDYSSVITSFITILIPPQPDPLPVERVVKAIVVPAADDDDDNSPDCVVPVECITSQVRLCIPTEVVTATSSLPWTLQSLNLYGQPTMRTERAALLWPLVSTSTFPYEMECHDEFYMVYHTHEHAIKGNRPLAIAMLTQQQTQQQVATTSTPLNGSGNSNTVPPYTIEWVTSPMNFDASILTQSKTPKAGHVSIHFCYTAGIGALPPPIKQYWHNGGSTQTCYIHHNVKSPFESNGSNVGIRHFCPPSLGLQLSQRHDRIVAVGDSILEQLVASKSAASNESESIYFGTKIAMPLLTHTVPLFVQAVDEALQNAIGMNRGQNDNNDTEHHCSDDTHDDDRHDRPKTRVALILNSALWDVLSDEATIPSPNDQDSPSNEQNGRSVNYTSSSLHDPWANHIQALSEYLVAVRELCDGKYVQQQHLHDVTIYWLLPTAVHIHRVHLADCESTQQRAPHKIRRTMYMSASRTRQLYERQQHVVASLLSSLSMQQCVPPSRPEQTIQQLDDGNDATFADIGAAESSTSFMLDLYEATYLSADWTLPGDGRHYRPELNARMLSWFL